MPQQITRPNSTIDNGGWDIIGAPTHHEALNEEVKDDDVSYVECVPGNTMLKIGLSAIEEPHVRSGHVVRVWAKGFGSGKAESFDGYMYQGETLIAHLYDPRSAGRFDYGYYWKNMGVDEAELITDYSLLELHFMPNTLGAGESIRITMVEFEAPFPVVWKPPVIMIN